MDIVKSSELKTGSAQIYIPPDKKYEFRVDGNIILTDQDGMPIDLKGKSPGIINVETTDIWNVKYQETHHHVADEVPFEVDVDQQPEDIMSRMRALITEEVMNRYGAGSEEVETLEESMNFDIDGDGEIGSPYEIPDVDTTMEPEDLTEPPPSVQPVSEPETTTEPETPPTTP
jgi:hypothetical protein